MLPDAPSHFAPPVANRGFGAPRARTPAGRDIINRAAGFARTPPPALTETLFDEFRRTGVRDTYEKPFNERMERLAAFTWAEGIENKKHYLPLIFTEFAAILDEPSWAAPAHAGRRRPTWKSNYDNVDLAAAARAWSLATIDWLLADQLPAGLRNRLRTETRARVFTPYLARARAAEDAANFGWMNVAHNWNPVCNAGVTGAALLLLDPREPAGRHEQAEFVTALETYAPAYLSGFGDDGWCAESISYWNYGFGHFILASETIRRVTGGKLDLLEHPKTRAIAAFGLRQEIAGGLYPAFGDSSARHKPFYWILDFSAARFGSGDTTGTPSFEAPHPLGPHLYRVLLDLSIPRAAPGATPSASPSPSASRSPDNETRLALRDWFPDGGALVSRPRPATAGLAVAMKGGHNQQPHNHNDLGTFVLVRDGALVLSDLGADTYNRAVFQSGLRYTSGVNNSFGHPVPRVAGKLQRTGKDARAITLRTGFTDARDLWEIDITSAYAPDVPELRILTRTFILTRTTGGGRFEIIDRASFSTPQVFGNALILDPRQRHTPDGGNAFRIHRGRQSVRVSWTATAIADITADARPIPLRIGSEPVTGIVPEQPPKGLRLGFDLMEPVTEAELRLVITP
ncbi:MAG: heparinase II/III-family protein [Opitutaceae bacterium]|jgi:hypothetical protein|nr:heparinase II/III-family protein [Opitutaceae bacterium]